MLEPMVKNDIDEDLQPLRTRYGLIGWVNEVNGKDADQVPEFVPTRHELLQIAKYWERKRLEIGFRIYWAERCDSSDLRILHFAERRINAIADLLDDSILPVLKEAFEGGQGRNGQGARGFGYSSALG